MTKGNQIYALKDGVKPYKTANLSAYLFNNLKTLPDVPSYAKGPTPIGILTGKVETLGNTSFVEANINIFVKDQVWPLRDVYALDKRANTYRLFTQDVWFVGSEITENEVLSTADDEAKIAQDKITMPLCLLPPLPQKVD
jgi:hypothetical protein